VIISFLSFLPWEVFGMVLKEAFVGHGNLLSFFSSLLSVSVDGRDLHVKRKGTGLRPACGLCLVSSSLYHIVFAFCSDSVPQWQQPFLHQHGWVDRVVQSEELCI
jgi:hypothetical protein